MSGADIGSILSGIGTIILAVIAVMKRPRVTVDEGPGEPDSPQRKSGNPWPFAIAGLILGITAICLVVLPRLPATASAEVSITYPTRDAVVTRNIVVEGYTTGELSAGRFLYVVVEWGGRWWPQYSNLTPAYSQQSQRWEFSVPVQVGEAGDSGKIFTLGAVVVDAAVHSRFQDWLRQEDWPGILINDANQWGAVEIFSFTTVIRS